MGLTTPISPKPLLLRTYLILHTTTLLLSTLFLLSILLPAPLNPTRLLPILPSLEIDIPSICREIDDSFGRDEGWLERCEITFGVVRMGVAWVGGLLVGVQWWALGRIWGWSWGRRRGERGDAVGGDFDADGESVDVELGGRLGEKMGDL